MGQIYILENQKNGKCYVGQTVYNVKKRLYSHMKSKYPIGNALKKYGIDNFDTHTMQCPEYLLDVCEVGLIELLNCLAPNGYNLDLGGHKHKHRSLATRKKLSEANKGKKRSEETRKLMSENHDDRSGEKNPMFGVHICGKNHHFYGKHHSETTKKLMSDNNKGKNNPMYGRTGKNHPRARKVQCIETNETFDTITEAAIKYDVCRHGIGACCKGKRKTAGGYHWEYKEKGKE